VAKKKPASNGANMNVFYGVLGLVAVVGIAGILYARSRSSMATEPLDMSQVANAETLVQQAQGISIGPEDAPIQMLVFSDFMCPGCGHWATSVEPHIKRDFVETGKVRYTYYDYPLTPGHKYSFVAARASRCAGDQGKFWEYHDRLFASQQQWSFSPSVPTDLLVQYAGEVGVEQGRFESCLRSDAHAEVVTANKMLGETLGVGGTPTVFVNGRQMTDWQVYARIKPFLEGMLPATSGASADTAVAAGN